MWCTVRVRIFIPRWIFSSFKTIFDQSIYYLLNTLSTLLTSNWPFICECMCGLYSVLLLYMYTTPHYLNYCIYILSFLISLQTLFSFCSYYRIFCLSIQYFILFILYIFFISFLHNFYYHIIVVLGVHCDIYKSSYSIS
jgi:hypothetical protein